MLRLGSDGFSYFCFFIPFAHLEVDPSLLGWSRWRGMYCAWAERCSEGGKGRVVKWRIWFPLPLLPLLLFPLFTYFIWGWRYYGKCSKNFVFAFLYYVLKCFLIPLYFTLLYCIDPKSLFCFWHLRLYLSENGGLVLLGRPWRGKGREGVWFCLC